MQVQQTRRRGDGRRRWRNGDSESYTVACVHIAVIDVRADRVTRGGVSFACDKRNHVVETQSECCQQALYKRPLIHSAVV